MWYSFYMNEKMLLDNWHDYKEANWLLKDILAKDKRKTPEERYDFYMANRNEYNDEWLVDYVTDEMIDRYYERQWAYEEFLEEGDACGHGYVYPPSKAAKRLIDKANNLKVYKSRLEDYFKYVDDKPDLRQIDEVIIYKSDLEVIEQAKKKHKLTELQVQIIFGLIFFSRMNGVPYARVGNKFKQRQFKGCFEKTIKREDYDAILKTGLFKVYTNAKQVKRKEISSKQFEFDYIYLNFDIQDEAGYVFKTTAENNKLNLTQVAKEALDLKIKYCSECGKPFLPNSNRQKMCEQCKIEVTREQARLRKQKQRKRQKGK